MELKWLFIAWGVIMASVAIGSAVEKYQLNQCRISYSQSGRSVEDIAAICVK